jgi:PBSX family phage terminase large subunit
LHDYNILSGVTGSGKSWVANLIFYRAICEAGDNDKFLLSGNTSESLWDNCTSKILELDHGVGWLDYRTIGGRKRIVVIPTGTQVICVGANDEKSQDKIQGKSVSGWMADEIVKQPHSFTKMALSRCRKVIKKKDKIEMIRTPVIWTCNPDGPSHFIKVDYIDNQKLDVKNWSFGFGDNPACTKEYVEKIKNDYSGVFYDRMILGKWVLAEGVIYNEFNRTTHIVDSIPDLKDMYLAVDWGYDNPLAILLVGEDYDNRYYVIDEFYERQQLVDNSLKERLINKFSPYGYEFDTDAYCDTNRPEQMRQLGDLFPQLNVVGAVKDVIDGIQEVQKYFKKRADGSYGLVFHSRCINTIRDHENYRWKEDRKGVSKDEPLKVDDHACDGVRYLIYTRRNSYDFTSAPDVSVDMREVESIIGNRRA